MDVYFNVDESKTWSHQFEINQLNKKYLHIYTIAHVMYLYSTMKNGLYTIN